MKTTIHRDNTVTCWNVYTQGWDRRVPARQVSDRVLASLSPAERRRIERAAFRAGSDAWECDRCGRQFGASQGYAEVDGGYWCERCAGQADLTLANCP